jgi:hypothetical protein
MRIRIFLLAFCFACCGGTLRAQQKALRARPSEINSPERGVLSQSLKAWKVFSLEVLQEPASESTSELTFEWGNESIRFTGRNVPVADQQSRIIEIGPGYRREHVFPQLLQFRGKGVRMTIGKDFILGEYTDQGRKYIVEQLGHFMPGADASRIVVYDAADVIDQRQATCGVEGPNSSSTGNILNRETSLPREKAAGACRIVDIAVMANSTSYREHGSSIQETAAYIASIYSLSESDYTSAFTDDFRFHLTEIVVSTSSETDPWLHTDDIYRNLDNFWNFAITEFKSHHDLSSYWFSTQEFNGGVIGLAYMGFTCNTIGDAAIREFGGNAQTMRCLLSHEIGHNFNMSHDAAGSGFIMAPSINGSKQFSPDSKASFESFVASNAAACITECNVDDCEQSRVSDVRASVEAEGRSIRAAWQKMPGSQGYVVRWWERGSSSVMTQQLDSLAEDALIPLECSNASFYRVEVAMICTNGRPGTFTGLDIVNPGVPRIVLEGLDIICPGTSTKIRSSLTNGNQWYRDGIPLQGATGQELLVTEPGSYTVLSSSAGGCSYQSNELFIVQNLSAERPRLSADGPAEFCEGGRVELSSTAADRYQWLRDGTEIPGAESRTLEANTSGAYTVRVETADKCVMISDTILVQANPIPDMPSVRASRALALCPGDSVQLEISATSGIQWYQNGIAIPGAINPNYTTSEAGSYRVQVTNQFNCSSQSAEQVVSLSTAPTIPVLTATGAVNVCEGDSVNLQTDATANIQWLLDGTLIANAADRNLSAKQSGAYQVQVSNDAGCTSLSDAVPVQFKPVPSQPQIQASGQMAFCAGGKLSLQSNAIAAIQWLYNGSIIAGATNPSFEATQGGNYAVVATNVNGCSSTSASVSVTALASPAKPAISAGGATSFCQGGSVVLNTDASAGIQWFRDGVAITNAVSSTLQATQTGVYLVRATNSNGCSSPNSDTLTVRVHENPAKPPINWNGTELSTLAGFKTYRWLKDGIEIQGAVSNAYRPTAAGNYQTAVTNNNDCPAVSNSYPLVITGLQDVVIAGVSVLCFPNPARDAVHLRVVGTNPIGALTASLVDMHGRHLNRQKLQAGINRFETGHLAAGIYFLLVTDGKDRQIIKFFVSR